MNQLIGFAGQFYTLWSFERQPVYVTDSYGNHHLARTDTKYYYHKNISKSLAKAQAEYPDLRVDNELRGITRSFDVRGNDERPKHIFWAGRHAGKNIAEVIKFDLSYVLWAHSIDMGGSAEFIETLTEFKAHVNNQIIARAKQTERYLAMGDYLRSGQPITIHGKTNGRNVRTIGNAEIGCSFKAEFEYEGEDISVEVHVRNFVRVAQGTEYAHIQPVVNDKQTKTRNKVFVVYPTAALGEWDLGSGADIWIDELCDGYNVKQNHI